MLRNVNNNSLDSFDLIAMFSDLCFSCVFMHHLADLALFSVVWRTALNFGVCHFQNSFLEY